jgi:hypothetical protein
MERFEQRASEAPKDSLEMGLSERSLLDVQSQLGERIDNGGLEVSEFDNDDLVVISAVEFQLTNGRFDRMDPQEMASFDRTVCRALRLNKLVREAVFGGESPQPVLPSIAANPGEAGNEAIKMARAAAFDGAGVESGREETVDLLLRYRSFVAGDDPESFENADQASLLIAAMAGKSEEAFDKAALETMGRNDVPLGGPALSEEVIIDASNIKDKDIYEWMENGASPEVGD